MYIGSGYGIAMWQHPAVGYGTRFAELVVNTLQHNYANVLVAVVLKFLSNDLKYV